VPIALWEEAEEESAANRKTLDDLKARLDALNREYRDGLLSDQPMSGALE